MRALGIVPDYYEILQVSPSAHPDVIQAAYRRLALLYHPDRNPSEDAVRIMAQLNEAYAVLSDPEQRAQYDRKRGTQPADAAPKGPTADSTSASTPAGRGRGRVRRPGPSPVREAFYSASVLIKRQVGFFGRPISVVAGVPALFGAFQAVLASRELGVPLQVLFMPVTALLVVVAFFWWWFLGSAVLLGAWKLTRKAAAWVRARIRTLREGSSEREGAPSHADAAERMSWRELPPYLAELGRALVARWLRLLRDVRRPWRDLLPHFVVLGRAIVGAPVRFFGLPISIIALAYTLWVVWSTVSDARFQEDVLRGYVLGPDAPGVVAAMDAVLTSVLVGPLYLAIPLALWLYAAAFLAVLWWLVQMLAALVLRRGGTPGRGGGAHG